MGLQVLGESITATPAPNTRIDLPGLGFVILNEQIRKVGTGRLRLRQQRKIGDVLRSGPSFRVVMPCFGTNGKLKTNTGAGVSLPDVLVTGTIKNTAKGTVNATTAAGETTATVESANVLDGLVKATVIKAKANAAKDGDTFKFSGAGSTFGSLSVQGFPGIDADVARNTKLNIAGLGTLFLNGSSASPTSSRSA